MHGNRKIREWRGRTSTASHCWYHSIFQSCKYQTSGYWYEDRYTDHKTQYSQVFVANQILTKVLRNGQEKGVFSIHGGIGGHCIFACRRMKPDSYHSVIKSAYSHIDSHVRTEAIKICRNALGYWNGYKSFKGDLKIIGSRRKKDDYNKLKIYI